MPDPAYYDGGLFKFIPFDNKSWIIELIKQSVVKQEIQLIIGVYIISCVLSLATLIKIIFIYDDNNKNIKYKQSEDKKYCNKVKLTSFSSNTTYKYLHNLHFDNKSIFSDQFIKQDNNNKHYIQINHDEIQISKGLPIEGALNIEHFNKQFVQYLKFIDTIQCDDEKENLRNNQMNEWYTMDDLFKLRRKSLCRLSICSTIVIICFLVFICSYIISIQHRQYLMQQINHLPIKFKQITLQTGQFSQYSIDIAYNLTKIHIYNDELNRSPSKSLLNQFIGSVKQFIAKVITCLSTNLCSTNNKSTMNLNFLTILMLKQDNISLKQLLENISIESKIILDNFDLVLHHYVNLNNVARLLNPEKIKTIEHSWYAYRQSLSSFTDINQYLIKENISSMLVYPWYTSPIIQQTKQILCDRLKYSSSQLIDFTSCKQVDQFLSNLIQYSTHLPLTLPMRSLTSALMYDLIPQALNIEQLVHEWLPVIDNISNNCINFLFETYLKPQLNKTKYEMTTFIQQFPSVEFIEQMNKITSYINITLLFYYILLIFFSIILIGIYIHLFISGYQYMLGQNPQYKTCLNNKSQFSMHKHRSVGVRFTLGAISIICFLLTVISLTCVYISVIGINEGCMYLQSNNINNLAQTKADQLITEYLKNFIYNIKEAKRFLSIPNLNLQIPKNILKTINSKYIPERNLPLLKSLQINRPFNFTNVLYSNYIHLLLNNLWYKEIISKIKNYNFKLNIPPIDFKALYKQTKTTLNLTRSFDNLFVGTVNNYLIDPEEINYFNIILRNLKSIPHNEEHQHQYLIYLYENINNLFQEYHINYLLVTRTIKNY
ncbi:unnamed protein product [Schistosoma turkestanicum]|nr:unnamed protein product [Schistosoma turkestanicum]